MLSVCFRVMVRLTSVGLSFRCHSYSYSHSPSFNPTNDTTGQNPYHFNAVVLTVHAYAFACMHVCVYYVCTSIDHSV